MKRILVCLDRDGTINKDENYYLGKSPDWRNQLDFLPGVVDGIAVLNSIPDSAFYIVTNQSGVAIASDAKDPDFVNLNEDRMHEVNKYVIARLAACGARIDGYFACPFVTSKYLEKAEKKGRTIDPKYVCDNCNDLKPHTGMLEKAARAAGWTSLKGGKGFMIGDRISDVETALNAGWTGILVINDPLAQAEDMAKAYELSQESRNRVYLCAGFLDAAKLIYDRST